MAKSSEVETKPAEEGERPSKAPVRKKAHRTRLALLKAAEKVFVDKGYLEARVADITREAGVAHGTFYSYFDSKEDIFRSTAVTVVEEIYEALRSPAPGKDLVTRVRLANRQFMDLYRKHADLIGLIEQVATFNSEFREMRLELRRVQVERVEKALKSRYDEGLLDIDPHVAANALGSMMDNFAFVWFVLELPFDRETALDTLDEIWLRSLRLDKETKA